MAAKAKENKRLNEALLEMAQDFRGTVANPRRA
jgi:hypothetical protein